MTDLIVNSTLLREFEERDLLNYYTYYVKNQEDIEDEVKIRANLEYILDWERSGEAGLGIYCGKFEYPREVDWQELIKLIKDTGQIILDNKPENAKPKQEGKIKYTTHNEKYLDKYVLNNIFVKEKKVPPRIAPKGCWYQGVYYPSRYQAIAKTGLKKRELYKYLEETGQLDDNDKIKQQRRCEPMVRMCFIKHLETKS